MPEFVEVDTGKEPLEARVGAERVGHGFDCQVNQAVVVFEDGTFHLPKRLVEFAEANVNTGEIEYWNIALTGQGL